MDLYSCHVPREGGGELRDVSMLGNSRAPKNVKKARRESRGGVLHRSVEIIAKGECGKR